MNFRAHVYPERIVFQIAPMVDILLFLLVFFILTWNFSRNEAELDEGARGSRGQREPTSGRRSDPQCEERRRNRDEPLTDVTRGAARDLDPYRKALSGPGRHSPWR